jgi:hypothetical protein
MSMAGFTLGEQVETFAGRINADTHQPIWRQEHLKRVAIVPPPGFRSGYLTYGACHEPGRIVRMKINYEDGSLDLFERILEALEDRYGRGTWRGNAFGTLRTWKWSLTSKDGDSISMILMNYRGEDDSFTSGNSIRLANRSAMNRERACGEKRKTRDAAVPNADTPPSDPEWYLPK